MRRFDDDKDSDRLRSWLERAGRLFQGYSCFVAAVGAFSRLIDVEPGSSKAWYGLADVLLCLDGQRQNRDLGLLRDAARCAKSALQADPTHELAGELLDVIARKTPSSRDQVASVTAFSAVSPELGERLGFTDATFAEAMLEMPRHGQRMQVVMWLGILDEPCGREILLAALDDSNVDVRMAALKRLNASDDPRIAAKVERLASGEGESCEPYLSMALKRFAREGAHSRDWALRLLESIRDDGPPQRTGLEFLTGRPDRVN